MIFIILIVDIYCLIAYLLHRWCVTGSHSLGISPAFTVNATEPFSTHQKIIVVVGENCAVNRCRDLRIALPLPCIFFPGSFTGRRWNPGESHYYHPEFQQEIKCPKTTAINPVILIRLILVFGETKPYSFTLSWGNISNETKM